MGRHDAKPAKRKSEKEKHREDIAGYLDHAFAPNDTEGGACVWRGYGKYQAHTCSYRYQCYKRTGDVAELYKWPASHRNGSVRTDRSGGYPKYYRDTLKLPEGTEWDFGEGDNFTKGYVPYWNEAHHMIPVSVLSGCIAELATEVVPDRTNAGKTTLIVHGTIMREIREGLLKEKYNINHKRNMICLPIDRSISDILGLPRHKRPKDHDHKAYSRLVKGLVMDALEGVKKEFVGTPSQQHPKREPIKVAKEVLEASSDSLFDLMIRSKAALAVSSLDDLAVSLGA